MVGSSWPHSAASSTIVWGRSPPSRWSCSSTFGRSAHLIAGGRAGSGRFDARRVAHAGHPCTATPGDGRSRTCACSPPSTSWPRAVGEPLGSSEWVTIDQDRVDRFAEATGDHQWIHVDVDRAKDGPFGGTIAHGYLTLSLLPMLGAQIFALDTPGAKLNYGVNKVRFPSPVPVGARVRAHGHASPVSPTCRPARSSPSAGSIEIEGAAKPACVAETVVLLLS